MTIPIWKVSLSFSVVTESDDADSPLSVSDEEAEGVVETEGVVLPHATSMTAIREAASKRNDFFFIIIHQPFYTLKHIIKIKDILALFLSEKYP